MYSVIIYNTTGIVSPKYDIILNDVIAWVPWVKWCTYTTSEPKLLCTFNTINDPSPIGVRVSPISTCKVLYCIRNSITIKIIRLYIVRRVIYRIC